MAQAKVTEFFGARKRNADFQPSKRRKVARVTEAEVTNDVAPLDIKSPPVAARTRRGASKIVPAPDLNAQKTVNKQRVRAPKGSRAKVKPNHGESKIVNVLKNVEEIINNATSTKDGLEITAESTAICDDHNGTPPCTPTKRAAEVEGKTGHSKRCRSTKARKDLLQDMEKTPEVYDFSKFAQTNSSARKRLLLPIKDNEAISSSATLLITSKQKLKSTDETLKPSSKEKEEMNESVNEKVKEVQAPADKSKLPSSKPKGKLDPAALRKQLSNSGKLAELQERLAEYSKSVKKVKEARNKALQEEANEVRAAEEEAILVEKQPKAKVKPASKETTTSKSTEASKVATQPKAPAYQRFQHLAEPVAPTLSLPHKYRVLQDMFQSADTVVSMLFKRSETITFSKLKAAVQQMTNKNFEQKNLGQIKTVYPDAYDMRQSKGLPKHGYRNCDSSYQLTIEPVLPPNEDGKLFDKEGRPNFTATQVLERKGFFHRSLISIVKKLHKEFLTKLDRPLLIPDDKLTRWHPRFKLEDLPDVEAAELPQSPITNKLVTARDVLEEAKGRLNPRIQKALELVASPTKEEKKDEEKKVSGGENDQTKKTESTQLKGVSTSLLERIRAKESRKQEAAMLRSPEEEKRLQMMERIPDLMRILRSHYLTQKKPALEMESTITKLGQSYRTALGQAETEKHMKLMIELLPEWIQVLKVKTMTYMKLDRNKDVNVLIEKIDKLRNQAK